jgi:tRNA threonylcarbamoyladenosine biosynthesis protein TsaB
VRVAVATAKALAFALHKPLVGVSTLEICAAQYQLWSGPVCSILEAGRAELYAACYRFPQSPDADQFTIRPHQLGDYQVLTPGLLIEYLQREITPQLESVGSQQGISYLFCGEISETARQELSQHLPAQSVFAPTIQSARRASLLASLAQQRLAEQQQDDPLLLEPLYLRRPSITTSVRKQPLLGSKASQIAQQSDQHSTEREEGALRH